jgi:hypothetical protein
LRTTKAERRQAQRQHKLRLRAAFPSSLSPLQSERANCGERGGGTQLRQGTFYPELTLGAGALSYNRRAELQQFLVAVVRKRNCPLHVANLWNAVYFNYDLAYGGFRADQLEQKRIPTRTSLARDFSLPVGGFVRVHTETACGDMLAEVVYKEGAHPEIVGDGWVDPALSGAPATVIDEVAGQQVAVVRERFVLDLAAFGPEGNSVTAKQYERICRRALWLDEHGHLLMEATYGLEEAELDDLDYYADYLLREHRDGLLAFCFSEELSDEELREALLRSFEAVRELAATSPELRGWRDKYFFLEADYRRRLADSGALGGGDLHSLYLGLTRFPARDRRGYAPLGPRILELLERDGSSAEDEALVRGCAYATAACHANAYVADALAREQSGGVLASGVHLRLDDDWQAGGIWRAERVDDPDHYALAAVSPLIPLGLGHSETGGPAKEAFAADEQPIAASQTSFRVALTVRDRALGRLRLSAEAAAALAPGPIDMVVRHAETRERTAVEREGATLYGIEWPWEFHPGIVLTANVEAHGSVVRVRTTPVTPPLVAADGKSFDYETSLTVYERETGLAELKPGERRGVPTLAELIHRAFRLRGRPCHDGARALTLSGLATIVLGPVWKPGETRPIAAALAAMGLERDGLDYLWRPRVTARTRSLDRTLLAAYGEAQPRGRLASAVRRHWVPMHIRRYDEWSGRSPSAAKRASYAEARRRYKMHGVLPEQLPENCTWVEPYDWGGEDAPPLVPEQPEAENGVLDAIGFAAERSQPPAESVATDASPNSRVNQSVS